MTGADGAPFWMAAGAALALHAAVAAALFAGGEGGQDHVTIGPIEIVVAAAAPESSSRAPTSALAVVPAKPEAVAPKSAMAPPSPHAGAGGVNVAATPAAAASEGALPAVPVAGEGTPVPPGQMAALSPTGAGGGDTGPAETTPPRYRLGAAETPAPSYPVLARRRGIEGRVVVRLHVGADGHAKAAAIESTSGHDVLDRAAAETLATWRLAPAERAGRAVPATILVPIRFRLEG